MYSALEVFVHAGPVSLVAMSQLDWEKSLLQRDPHPARARRLLSIGLGPVTVRVDSPTDQPRKAAVVGAER